MKEDTKKIESYFSRIESIRYENEHGGAYAYVQFLAYSRELMRLLRPFKRLEKEMETIESITWLFNEYLAAKFTPRQKSIFEEKMIKSTSKNTPFINKKMKGKVIGIINKNQLTIN